MTQSSQPRLGGLLTAQFFGAFNDNAMKLMIAFIAGAVAEGMVEGAQAEEVARQTQTTIAFVVFTLPMMLFSLPAALLADRLSKRSIILAMKGFELLLMLGGAVVFAYNPNGGVAAMVILGLMGLQSALFSPAKYGIMPEICDERSLTAGNAQLQMWTFLAIIAGNGIGGVLSEELQPHVAMGLLVLLAGVGLVAALGVPRVPASARKSSAGSLSGAFQAIRSDRRLRLVVAGETVFWLLASLLGQDVMVYAKNALELSDTLAGMTFVMFGIGIGVGSVIAGRVSRQGIEPGLIPLGAVGLAVGTTLLGFGPGMYSTLILMAAMGVAAGLVIVPMDAMLQWYSPADRRGAVIAVANVPIFFGVLLGSLIVYFMAVRLEYSAATILLVAGLCTVAATLWAMWLLPQALLRMALVLFTRLCYRVRIVGKEHIPAEGGALIVCNHVSLLDGMFLLTSSQRPIRFLVDSSYFHHWALRWGMKLIGAIPISAGSPRELMRAMKDAGQYLKDGELVCIFAEGEITRTGQLLPFRRGLTRILKGNEEVPVIPAQLEQVWGSPFSPKGGGFLRSWSGPFPRPVTVSFGAPMPGSSEVGAIRRAVKDLEENAWKLRQLDRPPLHHSFIRLTRRRPFGEAVVDSSGKRLSRFKLLVGAIALARLERDSWKGQEHIGILLPPTAGSAVANLAVALSGRCSVNLNYTTGSAGLASACRQAGLRRVLSSKAFLDKLELSLPEDVEVVLLEELMPKIGGAQRRAAALKALFASPQRIESWVGADRHPGGEDLCTIIFSSGSTGEPKGVMLSHHNVDANAQSAVQVLKVRSGDKVLGILPQFHSFGYMLTWFSLNSGTPLVCHTNPVDAATIGPLIEKEKITLVIATPTFLQMWMRRCTPGQFGAVRMVITGAEKLKQDTADAFEERFGVRPLEGYGTSECAPVVAVGTPAYRARGFYQPGSKRGSIGQAIPGVTVKIVDPDSGVERGVDEPGMLWVRGPNVMRGYLGKPELSAEVLRDGWYITGDIARIDEDGYIFITDRLSRFSKIGGEMVPHGKVEEELHLAAGVSTEQVFAVTGVPDKKKGERLAVLTTLEAARIPAVLETLAGRGLPNIFLPRAEHFVCVAEIPVLGTGKLDLKGIKQMALEADGTC